VTEQRRAFEAAQCLARIVESSGDAIIGETLEGVITSWNPAAEAIFGYSGAEIVGRSARLLVPEDQVSQFTSVRAKVYAGQPVEHLETFNVRKDATVFPISLTVSPIRADGAVVGASVICRDLTEQQKALEAAQRLAAIVEYSDDAIMASTLDGIITSWNRSAGRLFGCLAAEIIGKPISLLAPEDRADEVRANLAKVRAGQHVEHMETVRVRKDGTMFPVSLTVSPICDTGGTIVGTSVIYRDVTEQERAEQAVQQDRDLLRATMDSLMDPHVLLETVRDEAGKIVDFVYVDANPAACAYNGMDHEHLVGARLLDLQPGSIGYGLLEKYVHVVETGEPLVLDDIVYAQELLGAQERHYDVRAARVGDGLSYTWRDVSDRHAAAQWLAESEEHYRLLAENASDVVMRLSPDRRFEWVSGSVGDVLGWAAPDLLGHAIDEFIHPEELASFRQSGAGTSPESVASTEFRFRRSDGNYRWVLCHTRLNMNEDSDPVALVGGLIDIEARKAVQAKEMDRLETLERFQRLTLGRELKMIELKKEIESLRRLVHKDRDDGDKH
jgi:PAS domain S-box-containing protein